MSNLNRVQIQLIILLGNILLAGNLLWGDTYVSHADKTPYYQRRLQQDGYNTETADGIIAATKSKSSFVREIALELITSRSPKDAVPALKQALNDKQIDVRRTAAHLLGTLGDKEGLEQMQKDFEAFVPKEEEPNDPNIIRKPDTLDQWTKNHRYRICTALEIGKVLAELGDFRAYNLAAKEGLTDTKELGAIRMRAAEVLGEIGKKDVNELKTQGMEPIAVLCKMAETEKEWAVFHRIETVANEIGEKAAVQIYEKAVINSNIAKDKKDITKMVLKELKEKTEPNNP